MSISHFRSAEPLYIVMIRQDHAEKKLQQWAKSSQSPVTIEGNRMKVFEQRSLDRFFVDWPGAWDQVVIWDCWNKRHIYHT